MIASNVAVTGQAPPAPQPREVAQTRTPTPRPVAEPAAAAAPAPAPTPEPAPVQVAKAEKPARLPATGSSLPLFGTVGLLFVGASFGLRAFRR